MSATVPYSSLIDWSIVDACVVRGTWDYHERLPDFLAWIDRVDSATTLLNPARILRANVDKRYLADLAAAGVPTVPTAWLPRGSRVDAPALLRERGWERAVAKPTVDLSAWNARRLDAARPEDAQRALDSLIAAKDVMVQPFLSRVATVGELSIVLVDGKPTHAARKRPAVGDWRVQERLGGSVAPAEAPPAAIEIAERALATLPETPAYARADFLESDDGALLLSELELVEPSLYYRAGPHAAERLADAILARLA